MGLGDTIEGAIRQQVRGYNRMRMVTITRGVMAGYHHVRGCTRLRMVTITRGVMAGYQHVSRIRVVHGHR